MIERLKRFWFVKNEGASSIEYALLVSFLALAIIVAIQLLGSNTANLFSTTSSAISSASSQGSGGGAGGGAGGSGSGGGQGGGNGKGNGGGNAYGRGT